MLNMAVPLAARRRHACSTPGTRMGMRGTGSHDVELRRRVRARRAGAGPPARTARIDAPAPGDPRASPSRPSPRSTSAWPRPPATTPSPPSPAPPRADDPIVQRQVGLMDTRLRVAGWALDGALAVVGDDPEPSMDTVVAVMAAKREIALAGVEVCDLAMEVAGGAAFYRLVADRAVLPRRARGQVPPVHARRRRSSTPARSPSASPPTRSERRRPARLRVRALPGRASDPTLRALDVGEEVLLASRGPARDEPVAPDLGRPCGLLGREVLLRPRRRGPAPTRSAHRGVSPEARLVRKHLRSPGGSSGGAPPIACRWRSIHRRIRARSPARRSGSP